MRFRSIARSVRRWIAGLAALTVLGLFAPGAAVAGCAHPLLKFDESAVLDFADFQAPSGSQRDRDPAPIEHRPCTGAFCSGQPATPVSAATSVPLPGFDRWFASIEPALRPVSTGSRLFVDDDPVAPDFVGSSLFRPPRAR